LNSGDAESVWILLEVDHFESCSVLVGKLRQLVMDLVSSVFFLKWSKTVLLSYFERCCTLKRLTCLFICLYILLSLAFLGAFSHGVVSA